MSIAAIVLAAGGSTRMGMPKQLLNFRGESFLHRSISAAASVGCSPIIVVLGSNADKINDRVDPKLATTVLNPNWQAGMGGSIRAGIERLDDFPTVQAALIMLCDQPLIDAAVLRQLFDLLNHSTTPIVAASYSGTAGVPAIFPRRLFSALKELPPSSGAKQLLIQQITAVKLVPLDAFALDVDTPEEYRNLQANGLQ